MKTTFIILFTSLLISGPIYAQNKTTDWSSVDFIDKYKVNLKIPGSTGKALHKGKIFISHYGLDQAVKMNGSNSTAGSAMYNTVQFGGISREAYQKLVDELYADLVQKLQNAGFEISEGTEVIKSDFAKKNEGDKYHIGKSSGQPQPDKAGILDGGIPGYGAWAVKEGLNFEPDNINVYYTTKRIPGNFYIKTVQKTGINLMSVDYYLSFASFEKGRGYKSISLETHPALGVNPAVLFIPTSGYPSFQMKKGPIWGNSGWDDGIYTKKDNKDDAELLGLAWSTDYVMLAKEAEYIAEVKSIIENFQTDFVNELKKQTE